MTSRYNFFDDPSIHELLAAFSVDIGTLPERYNLAPTDQVPVIHCCEGKRLISDMRWWLVPHWCREPSTDYPMFNARCEKLEGSRAFQGCFRHKRCLIPANSFIEWRHVKAGKVPYLLSAEKKAITFAGLWDYWTDGIEHVLSCAIITKTATQSFQQFNPRMPVILVPEQGLVWLEESQQTDTLYELFDVELPYQLQAVQIDDEIGNARQKIKPKIMGDEVLLVEI